MLTLNSVALSLHLERGYAIVIAGLVILIAMDLALLIALSSPFAARCAVHGRALARVLHRSRERRLRPAERGADGELRRPDRDRMTYDEVIDNIAKVIEAVGVAVMVLGGLGAFLWAGRDLLRHAEGVYVQLRMHLGRVILLGLEVLIVGDIIRTIVVEPTIESVGVLAIIVLIRIVLSFSLEVEIDGTWPWRRGSDT